MTFSGWEAVFFWIFAVAALMTGLLTILARTAVHSALFLISSLLSVAALYILLGAEFVAGAQILVYVGGVMVLFLFVIMLVNVGAEEGGREAIFNSTKQVATSVVLLVILAIGLIVYIIPRGYQGLQKRDAAAIERFAERRQREQQALPPNATGRMRITRDTENLGGSLYRFSALAFEIASLLLLVAIVGSVMLARTLKQQAAVGDIDPELLEELMESTLEGNLEKADT